MTFIRPATAADVAVLSALKLRTFRETFLEGFKIPYPPHDLALFEQASYAPAAVARELADPSHSTWIAERDGVALAYAHVGPCKLPHPDVRPTDGELYQLYVLNAAQGLGLGRDLLNVALRELEARDAGPIWLGVWSGNVRAQAIYQSRGFEQVGTYQFPVGEWRDDELIYRKAAPAGTP